MQERLNVLEKMVNFHLDNAKTQMLAGERGDQEIHTGTVVEFSKQVNITMSKKPSPELEEAIDSFFGGDLLGGFGKLVHVAVNLRLFWGTLAWENMKELICSSSGRTMRYFAWMLIIIAGISLPTKLFRM